MLTLEIITPEAVVLDKCVSAVSLPTSEGEIQVLPGHIPLLGILVPGVVYLGDYQAQSIAIDQGFFQIMGDRVSLLVEGAIDVYQTDLESIQAAKLRAEEALERFRKEPVADPLELQRLESNLQFTILQEILKNKHPL